MKYTVLIETYAQKQIIKLGSKAIPVIKAAIAGLADNPRPYGYKKLKGEEAYLIRVGKCRMPDTGHRHFSVTTISTGLSSTERLFANSLRAFFFSGCNVAASLKLPLLTYLFSLKASICIASVLSSNLKAG